MPIYEYECKECREPFEVFVRSLRVTVDAVCPKCGSQHVEKEVTAASALGMNGAAFASSTTACAPSG